MKPPRKLSDAEKAIRSARLKAQLADPEFQARIEAGRSKSWTPERRALQARVMTERLADPAFQDKRLMGRRVAVPKNSHPIIRGLFLEMNEQRALLRDVVARSGLGEGTVAGWHSSSPNLPNLDAALNALDLQLAIVPFGMRDENGFVKKRSYVRRAETSEPSA